MVKQIQNLHDEEFTVRIAVVPGLAERAVHIVSKFKSWKHFGNLGPERYHEALGPDLFIFCFPLCFVSMCWPRVRLRKPIETNENIRTCLKTHTANQHENKKQCFGLAQLVESFPKMRAEHFLEDALSTERMGPGHLNSIDCLYREASREAKERTKH